MPISILFKQVLGGLSDAIFLHHLFSYDPEMEVRLAFPTERPSSQRVTW